MGNILQSLVSVGENAKINFYLKLFFCRHSSEIHFVHINQKYKTPAEAMKHPDGLAVLAFFINVIDGNGHPDVFEVSHECHLESLYLLAHFLLQLLFAFHQKLSSVVKTGLVKAPLQTRIPLVENLSDFFPAEAKGEAYFTYSGSLTTPNCNEAVTWILFQRPLGLELNEVLLLEYQKDQKDFFGRIIYEFHSS